MYAEAMIAASDVQRSARWYVELLDAETDHGLKEFDRILKDGRVLLMLHQWSDEHGPLAESADAEVGKGCVLWIHVEDLDAIYSRALAMDATILKPPWTNIAAGGREFTLRDPDGYRIVISQPQWRRTGC
jgi:predicted enzyme related to lactoylglutathione lyase